MIMGYFSAAVKLIGALSTGAKWAMAIGSIIALVTAYGAWHHQIYQSGIDAAIAGIAREDAKFINRAREARGKWQECRTQNRGWDQTTGQCR